MKHSNYEEIKRYIDDVENYTVISSGGEGWREVSGGYLFCESVSVKTVAKRHLQLALDFYNGKCPDGIEHLSVGDGWVSLGQVPHFYHGIEYRKAERHFEEGHWYPVIDQGGDKRVMVFKRDCFKPWVAALSSCKPSNLRHIGKSLGCDLHGEGE